MMVKEQLKAFRKKITSGICKICYCHVPKCAGMSVSAAIVRQFFKLHERLLIPNFGMDLEASGRVSKITSRPIGEIREELLAFALSLSKYKFASGHIPCRPKLVEEFHKTWNFVTILRNPVDRWISEYVYNTYKTASWAKNTLAVEEYVESKRGRAAGMTYLSYFSNIPDGFESSVQPSISEAIDNLSRFSVVGISEDMDNFVRQFEVVFGKRIKVPQKNASPKSELKQQIMEDKALMAKIEELCEPDRQIYQRIVERVHAANPGLGTPPTGLFKKMIATF